MILMQCTAQPCRFSSCIALKLSGHPSPKTMELSGREFISFQMEAPKSSGCQRWRAGSATCSNAQPRARWPRSLQPLVGHGDPHWLPRHHTERSPTSHGRRAPRYHSEPHLHIPVHSSHRPGRPQPEAVNPAQPRGARIWCVCDALSSWTPSAHSRAVMERTSTRHLWAQEAVLSSSSLQVA